MNQNDLINKFEDQKLTVRLFEAYWNIKRSNDGVTTIGNVVRINVKKMLEHVERNIIEINDNLEKILPYLNDVFKFTEDAGKTYEFYNLPECLHRPIPDIRSSDINNFIQVNGKIMAKGNLNPRAKEITYICNKCSKDTTLSPETFSFASPKKSIKCTCGGTMYIDHIDMEDLLYLQLEEHAEEVKLDSPKHIIVALKGHHTELKILKKLKMGVKVNLTGKIEHRKLNAQKEGDLVLILNSIEYLEEESDLKLSTRDIEMIDEMKHNSDRINKLCNMIDKNILGYHEIKESLLYYLVGSIQTDLIFPMINVLLVGEPGTAKSQLSKAIEKISPKIKYSSGKNSTSAGLTAGVVKDETMGGYSIKMGAIPLCNGGHVIADELDKLSDEDKSSMLEAMSMGTVSVNKVVSGKFQAKTSIMGIANPKKIKFNHKETIYEQLGFTQDLFSRFEFIWIIKNEVDEVKDGAIASMLINTMFNDSNEDNKNEEGQLFLKKYIKYVRDNFKPTLKRDNESSVKAGMLLNNFYVGSRKHDANLTARAINAAMKVACAHAKLRQSNVIEEIDAKRAIFILQKSYEGLQ